MPEFVNFHPALALSTDDPSFSSLGALPGLLLFVVALIIVGICMAASSQRRSWEGATVTVLVWGCAGLLMRPWTYFTNGPSRIETDAYWTPLWKIADLVWAVSLILCIAVVITILRHNQSRHRRRSRRRKFGEHRQRIKDEKSDTYEV